MNLVKLLNLETCEESEGVHALLKQEHPTFKYCPWCGKSIVSKLESIFSK